MHFITNIGDLLTQPILNTDTYKSTHWTFEHPEFERQYGYLEARKGGAFKEVQWFGFLYILRYFLSQRLTHAMIDEAKEELTAHGVETNEQMWRRVVDVHGGVPPICIKALPEGIVVPQGSTCCKPYGRAVFSLRRFVSRMSARTLPYTGCTRQPRKHSLNATMIGGAP